MPATVFDAGYSLHFPFDLLLYAESLSKLNIAERTVV